MKHQITTATALGLVLFAAAPAMGQDDGSAAQLASMEQYWQSRGVTLTRVAEFTHVLQSGDDARDNVRLADGANYLVMAACGQGCMDMDLVVRNGNGATVGADAEPDPTPIVNIDNASAGSHVVRASMAACNIGSCQARIRVYRAE